MSQLAEGERPTNGTSRLILLKSRCETKLEFVTLLSSAMDHVGFGYRLAKEGLGSAKKRATGEAGAVISRLGSKEG